MVHVNSDKACREAVAAGVHSIEHGYFIDPETLTLMAAKGIYWTPTIAAMANQILDPDKRFSSAQLEIIKRNAERQLEMIKFAYDAGVQLSIGTDSGSYNVPHGRTFLREMELFVEAGIEKTEVWQIATRNGWELLGLQGEPLLKLDRNLPLESLLEQSQAVLSEIKK
jgi:imidazolonepropionase-like amidohydrolase